MFWCWILVPIGNEIDKVGIWDIYKLNILLNLIVLNLFEFLHWCYAVDFFFLHKSFIRIHSVGVWVIKSLFNGIYLGSSNKNSFNSLVFLQQRGKKINLFFKPFLVTYTCTYVRTGLLNLYTKIRQKKILVKFKEVKKKPKK